jgi:signal transduction histidine kinase
MRPRKGPACAAARLHSLASARRAHDISDSNGEAIVQDIVKAVSAPRRTGWTDFEWGHPQTKGIEGKSRFNRKLKNFDGFDGTGILAPWLGACRGTMPLRQTAANQAS